MSTATRRVRRLLLGFWVLPAAPALAAPPPSACQVQLAELPVVSTRGQPLIEVDINGEHRRMLADTGAYTSLLWRETLPSLKLRTGNSVGYAGGVGGVTAVYQITVPRLTIGASEFRGQNFMVVGAPGGHYAEGDESGVFGADFLGQTDVQFDLPGKMIRLVKPTHCKGEEEVFWAGAFSDAPMATEAGSPRYLTTVRINGHPAPALIDTGASRSVITPGAAQQYGLTVKMTDEKSYGIGPKVLATGVARMETFGLGDETIKNTSIQVADVFKNDTREELGSRLGEFKESPSLILGADFFRSHKVLLARSQNRIFFSYVGGPVFDVTPRAQAAPPPAAAAPGKALGGPASG